MFSLNYDFAIHMNIFDCEFIPHIQILNASSEIILGIWSKFSLFSCCVT